MVTDKLNTLRLSSKIVIYFLSNPLAASDIGIP